MIEMFPAGYKYWLWPHATLWVCWITQLKWHLGCTFMVGCTAFDPSLSVISSLLMSSMLQTSSRWYCWALIASSDTFSQKILLHHISGLDSSSIRTALFTLVVMLLLLFAELLVSWKTRQMHIYWIIRMLSHCMHRSLSLDTTALCWSLFLMDVLKTTLTRTRCSLTGQCFMFIWKKIITILKIWAVSQAAR